MFTAQPCRVRPCTAPTAGRRQAVKRLPNADYTCWQPICGLHALNPCRECLIILWFGVDSCFSYCSYVLQDSVMVYLTQFGSILGRC
jgi:hypothetical protein